MTSHYGDGQLDIFDWLPLLVIVFGGVLLFSSLIPSTVLGRDARKDEDILGKHLLSHLYTLITL